MCGGEGSRLREGGVATEKPLVGVCGRPMFDRVCEALTDSRIETVYAAVSPATPRTREHAREQPNCAVVDTPGEGYVADLDCALESVGRPVLTVGADLPLLTAELVDRVLAAADCAGRRLDLDPEPGTDGEGRPSLTVCVPVALKRRLGVSVDTTIPPGTLETEVVLRGPPPADAHEDGSSLPELAPAGINVVADAGTAVWLSDDPKLAVNVNRPQDRSIAAERCR